MFHPVQFYGKRSIIGVCLNIGRSSDRPFLMFRFFDRFRQLVRPRKQIFDKIVSLACRIIFMLRQFFKQVLKVLIRLQVIGSRCFSDRKEHGAGLGTRQTVNQHEVFPGNDKVSDLSLSFRVVQRNDAVL